MGGALVLLRFDVRLPTRVSELASAPLGTAVFTNWKHKGKELHTSVGWVR